MGIKSSEFLEYFKSLFVDLFQSEVLFQVWDFIFTKFWLISDDLDEEEKKEKKYCILFSVLLTVFEKINNNLEYIYTKKDFVFALNFEAILFLCD